MRLSEPFSGCACVLRERVEQGTSSVVMTPLFIVIIVLIL